MFLYCPGAIELGVCLAKMLSIFPGVFVPLVIPPTFPLALSTHVNGRSDFLFLLEKEKAMMSSLLRPATRGWRRWLATSLVRLDAGGEDRDPVPCFPPSTPFAA